MHIFQFQTKDKQKTSKGNKKDDFKPALDLVVAAAGGDADSPKCKGSPAGSNDSITGV